MSNIINRLSNKIGFSVERFPKGDLLRRIKLLNFFKIDLIFDIGANEGQYVKILRRHGYKGNIVSFEPLTHSFKKLKENAKGDLSWEVRNYALGNENTKKQINIAGNEGQSSSFLGMAERHVQARSKSKYIGVEEVEVRRFDSIIKEFHTNEILFLKIDTQGYEKQVLEGMGLAFEKVSGFQIEMSLVDLYDNAVLYLDIIEILKNKGFHLYSIEPGFTDSKTGQLLQFDGLFFRSNA